MIKNLLIFFFLASNLLGFSLYAGKIEKGFIALKEYNYFKAKELFEKSFKKNVAPASFGLATIYSRSDNPFFSLDSAFNFILKAELSYGAISKKKKVHFKEFNFDYNAILDVRAKISSAFYAIANTENSIQSYTNFIHLHPWANEIFEATNTRDSLAFELAKKENTSKAFKYFIDNYPQSALLLIVQGEFNLAQYREMTISNNLLSYLEFIAKCPNNPYVLEAEDRIYEISTESNLIESYFWFIQTYPKNRNANIAWRNIYQLYMTEYSDERINQFKIDYPNYPFLQELEEDLIYMKLNLLPFKAQSYYGFMDYSGEIIIPADYEQLSFFKEGLALAMKNGLYGYIDKANRVVIAFQYSSGTDFENGRAVIEVDGKQGMIDRSGNLVFQPVFKDLGQLSENLTYGAKDSLYAYYDKNSNLRISEKFEEAFEFIDGIAKVQQNGNQGYIDEFGTFVVPPGYLEISFFSDSLLIFEDDNLIGLMKRNCQVVIPAKFQEIGQLSSNRALIVENDLIGFVNGVGEIVIPATFERYPNYLKRSQFVSNLAVVSQKEKFGIINQIGKIIVPISFNAIGEISSLTAFTKGNGWGFMDLTGKVILLPEYDYADSFKDGTAIVEKLTLLGVIDVKGKVVIPISYTSIDRITKDFFLVSNGAQFGVFTSKGELVVPLEYQQIRVIDKDLLVLINSNEVHYLYVPEKRIIQSTIKGE